MPVLPNFGATEVGRIGCFAERVFHFTEVDPTCRVNPQIKFGEGNDVGRTSVQCAFAGVRSETGDRALRIIWADSIDSSSRDRPQRAFW